MARVIVRHDDGRRFSVREDDPRATGADGWTVEGVETESSFAAVGIPQRRRPRKRPRAKDAAPVKPPADEG